MLTPPRLLDPKFLPEVTYELRTLKENKDIQAICPTNWSDRACFMAVTRYGKDPDMAPDPALIEEINQQVANGDIDKKEAQQRIDSLPVYLSVERILHRVAHTIGGWVQEQFPAETEAKHVLKKILEHQYAAFNSPVYFNVGLVEKPQISACFILGVEDTMESIFEEWLPAEARIFRFGSGAGANLSKIRGSNETLSGTTNTASGPISFMEVADSAAGAIKSGGKTRRAAKMVILEGDHPDIMEFVNLKVREEDIIWALHDCGFDMGYNSSDYQLHTTFQNANNSVALSDTFMEQVKRYVTTGEDSLHELRNRNTDDVASTIKVSELWNAFVKAQHTCGDPGSFFIDTANKWHTAPQVAPIRGTNPCSEYVNVDDSSCNLSSVNLGKFVTDERTFDAEAFADVCKFMLMCMESLVDKADYPTQKIETNSRGLRQLGLGYSNLAYALANLGKSYSQGTELAGLITSVMHFAATEQSIAMAKEVGSYEFINPENQKRVVQMHIEEYNNRHRNTIDTSDNARIYGPLRAVAEKSIKAINRQKGGKEMRNSQVTLLAPTGTISFIMDCSTTGIEPEYSLITYKLLAGKEGEKDFLLSISDLIKTTLLVSGRNQEEVDKIEQYILENKAIPDYLSDEEKEMLRCAVGPNPIDAHAHLNMMAACQPFLSGAISKTVNLPYRATEEEISNIHIRAWELGLKAVTVFREGSKYHAILDSSTSDPADIEHREANRKKYGNIQGGPVRNKPTGYRRAIVFDQRIGDENFYFTISMDENSQPVEIFSNSNAGGLEFYTFFSRIISWLLQLGIPLKEIIYKLRLKDSNGQSEMIYGHPNITSCTSPIDFLLQVLAFEFLSPEDRLALGIQSKAERKAELDQETKPTAPYTPIANARPITTFLVKEEHCAITPGCKGTMQQSGACKVCNSCGSSTGCS